MRRVVFYDRIGTERGRVSFLFLRQNTPENQCPKGGRIACGLMMLEPLVHGHLIPGLCSFVGSEHQSKDPMVTKTACLMVSRKQREGIELNHTLQGHAPETHLLQKAPPLNVSTIFQ